MSGITQEEIEQAQAREEQGNHDDHCRRDAEAHDAPHEFVLNRRTPVVHPCLCGGAAYYHECAGERIRLIRRWGSDKRSTCEDDFRDEDRLLSRSDSSVPSLRVTSYVCICRRHGANHLLLLLRRRAADGQGGAFRRVHGTFRRVSIRDFHAERFSRPCAV